MGVGVHPLTIGETVAVIGDWINSPRSESRRQVVTLNVEILYRAWHDHALRDVLNQADLVVPDGHGVVWAGRRLGKFLPERVTGIDLIQALADRAAREGWRLYLLGAAPGVAGEAAARLVAGHPGLIVAGTGHGYFSEQEAWSVVERIRSARADLLLVALGSPKQELFIEKYRRELGPGVAIGVGGSFDVLSGRLRRAPLVFQRLKLEWLYRLLQEPSRWRRVLVLPRFVLAVWFRGRPGRGDCTGGKGESLGRRSGAPE